VNESIEVKLTTKMMRQQLLSVIAHANMIIFTVDANRRISMLEGALPCDVTGEAENDHDSQWFVGECMYEMSNHLNPDRSAGERPSFLQPIEDILNGKVAEGMEEHVSGA
jgi:hypothetical protein